MNLTKLKNYAPAARTAIITAVTRRAATLGIQPGRVEEMTESGDVALIGGQPFPRSVVPLRKKLLELIQRDGFDHTMEAMAYTWFNRLVALRFMELHDGYLDHGYRVLSHPQGTPLPEILQHAEHVSLKGLDREEVIRLKLDGNRDEELYRLLLLAQCWELNQILPDVFSKLDDATILLLPDNLLHSDSVIRQLITGSDAEDWQQVEVLGWLYQFYISEKKDAVMARKSAVPTDDIPAVTQLFTPHWIVRYLVENSLGRLWLLNRPSSRLRDHMPYYIEGEQETDFLKITKPEEIKLVDPAVGSGHMLTYAFDLLTLIYEEEGYAANDIPGLILQHNLHGLDLCPRAAQLAELALVFKAREKSRRFFSPGNLVRPNIIELQNVRFAENELREYFQALGVQPSTFSPDLVKLLHQFEEAKNFGSLIQPCLNEAEVQNVRLQIQNSESNIQNSSGQLFLRETHLKVLRVLEQAEALTQRYHVVVANPPYMGVKPMNSAIQKLVTEKFAVGKSDLYGAFILRSFSMVHKGGSCAFITPPNWMFISTFEDLRMFLLKSCSITSMVHNGRGVWGPDFGSCAFCLSSTANNKTKGHYRRLFERDGEVNTNEELESRFHDKVGFPEFVASSEDFVRIPGSPIAYWASEKVLKAFSMGKLLGDFADVKRGMTTSDNATFLRLWMEVSRNRIGFGMSDGEAARKSGCKWFPYSKGGGFRKWYGFCEAVVNWEDDGRDVIGFAKTINKSFTRTIVNIPYYFQPSVAFPYITISRFSLRSLPSGFIYDSGGPGIFTNKERRQYLLALLNSEVAHKLLKILSPTINLQIADMVRFPVIPPEAISSNYLERANSISSQAVESARADWDNFETSWDFLDLPLLRPGLKGPTLEASWRNWELQGIAAIRRMQELETENNRLFIAAYGLEGELQPEVPEAQITLFCNPASRYKRKAKKKKAMEDASEDNVSDPEVLEEELSYAPEERSRLFRADTVREFLSYAVGCMMGRYSLDTEGLILANAGDSVRELLGKVKKPLDKLTFAPDEDGIIPMLDGEWFEDDLVARTKEFLRATFGEATLGENLRFIEQSLGRELRDYFLTDFYKDHIQTYKNRPIYWLFSSGKQKAFQCLVYLHRYTPGTLARIRTEYAIPLQGKLAARITRLEEEVIQTSSSAARKKLQTDLDKSKKQIVELLAFDEQLRSYADQAITLDLDDGVKANYAKFGTLVAEAKKICGTKDD